MNLDTDILLQTYDLTDMILQSEEIEHYKKYKEDMDKDPKVLTLKKRLAKEKQLFEETERFGKYHPNYQEAKEKVEKTLEELNQLDVVREFLQAEKELDELLFLVSQNIAHAISPTIKVPRNDEWLEEGLSCTTGGCNTCGLGGSCAVKIS